jgi:deoxyribodipyrimidine photolyase-related protein
MAGQTIQRLYVVLGDQLDPHAGFLDELNPRTDVVWMCEAIEENTHVPSHRARSVVFLSAMRHYRSALEARGIRVHYHELNPTVRSLSEQLRQDLKKLRPKHVFYTLPGEWRLGEAMRSLLTQSGIPHTECNDPHFWVTPVEFKAWAQGRKTLRLEHFYRHLRRQTGILMAGDEPIGGAFNFDEDNRKSFGNKGPGLRTPAKRFKPDSITLDVIDTVKQLLPNHVGSVDEFAWPVTRPQALKALADFVENRLALFGTYQDAMWHGEDLLYHSQLSQALNLKLLNPREVVAKAVAAYQAKQAPLAAVEGFVRQILGWREFVRGVYYLKMPAYQHLNYLEAQARLPAFYWTADTDYACLRDVISHTLARGYSHHIERLMVTGLFALLWGTHPQQVHEWFLAMYVDAVEWVELPNVLGMSQYADGGILATKPYIATGAYIDRMSNHCANCRYSPKLAVGETACPFTTLYWSFIHRHGDKLKSNPRIGFQVNHWLKRSDAERKAILKQADKLRTTIQS